MNLFDLGGSGQRTFNSTARWAFRSIFRISGRVHVEHLAPIPRTGPLILASNHVSHFDPPLLGAFFPRHVDWMAMEELFRQETFAKGLALTGAFPVHRDGSDRTALRTAARRLKAGRVVGIFPEGGIRAGETSILDGAPMRPGLAALSILAKAPVLPSIVAGTDRFYHRQNWWPGRRPPIWVITGFPIGPDSAPDRETLRARIASSFIELKRHLLSRPDFRPTDLPMTPQARKGEDPYSQG